jgi:hypothetical protein
VSVLLYASVSAGAYFVLRVVRDAKVEGCGSRIEADELRRRTEAELLPVVYLIVEH